MEKIYTKIIFIGILLSWADVRLLLSMPFNIMPIIDPHIYKSVEVGKEETLRESEIDGVEMQEFTKWARSKNH